MTIDAKVIQILHETRRLVKAGWTQHYYARDQFDEPVNTTDNAAVCFCLIGACYRAGRNVKAITEEINDARKVMAQRIGVNIFDGLASWNDIPGRTKEQVLSLIDEVIRGL